MAQKNKIDIAGIEGNMAAQSRVFAHSAKSLTIPTGATNSVDVLDLSAAGAGDTVSVISRGACLYVGGAGDVKVGMESGDEVVFVGVAAGSFLPIQVLKVFGSGSGGTSATDILALF